MGAACFLERLETGEDFANGKGARPRCYRKCPLSAPHNSRQATSLDIAHSGLSQCDVDSLVTDNLHLLHFSRLMEIDDGAQEVAQQIATDRQQQSFEDACLLPAQYKVSPPDLDSPLHVAVAEHRTTGVLRQLATFHKPAGKSSLERLRTLVGGLQKVGELTEGIVKVIDVYEDPFAVHLLQEYCTGGSVYDRILERQYFTEQESAVLVKHMLQALLPLHENGIFHGCLSPGSFHFLSSAPQSPLKLVDFGLELKIHWWDDIENSTMGEAETPRGSPGLTMDHHLRCIHLFEPCRLVFCPPEFAPDYMRAAPKKMDPPFAQSGGGSGGSAGGRGVVVIEQKHHAASASDGNGKDVLDGNALADVMEKHGDWFYQQSMSAKCNYQKKFEAADVWSIGAIAFVLLCGYPPFYAAHRNAILRRLHNDEYSFDAPFWSKISDEAKEFVTMCLTKVCWDRPSIQEALQHPWILNLAETSVGGPMLASFMLNLRRFHRTSMIEVYAANILARHFQRENAAEFLRRCRDVDANGAGFITPSGLRQVLMVLRFEEVAETIIGHFRKSLRHPGESYIDYVALLDAIHLRQQWLFKDELWRQFQRFSHARNADIAAEPSASAENLKAGHVGEFLADPMILTLLMREVPQQAGVEQATVRMYLQTCIEKYCKEQGVLSIGFNALAGLLLQKVRCHSYLLAYQRCRDGRAPSGGAARAPSTDLAVVLDADFVGGGSGGSDEGAAMPQPAG